LRGGQKGVKLGCGRQAKEKEALDRSEVLAEEGDVDGSILFANTADGFKTQWEQLHASFTQPERTMTVCDVCGVFINSTDNEQRRRVSKQG
jgi:RNA-binding protein Luc7-like 2